MSNYDGVPTHLLESHEAILEECISIYKAGIQLGMNDMGAGQSLLAKLAAAREEQSIVKDELRKRNYVRN